MLHFILIYKKVNKQPFVTGVCLVFLFPPHTHSQPRKQKQEQPEWNTPAWSSLPHGTNHFLLIPRRPPPPPFACWGPGPGCPTTRRGFDVRWTYESPWTTVKTMRDEESRWGSRTAFDPRRAIRKLHLSAPEWWGDAVRRYYLWIPEWSLVFGRPSPTQRPFVELFTLCAVVLLMSLSNYDDCWLLFLIKPPTKEP